MILPIIALSLALLAIIATLCAIAVQHMIRLDTDEETEEDAY
jgi:hypothetical protein